MPAARPPRTSARLEPQPRTPARAAGAGQQPQRGTYSAVRRTHDLLPTSLQPRVSARSESPCTRRPLRLESSPASNHSRHTLRPERQALDSERSAEHIWLHARRATCLPPPCSRESPRGVSRPMPAARPPRTTVRLEPKPHNYIFKKRKDPPTMNDLLDVHTHTIASGHAYSTLREMIEAAKRRMEKK